MSGPNLPWFLFDLRNYLLITSNSVPSDIKDTKQIIIAENPIPGLNYSPVSVGGFGNRHISFTIPIVNRKNPAGNTLLRAAFQNLRERTFFPDIIGGLDNFRSNPKVLYQYGVGVPMVYFVAKCDFGHKSQWINALGQSEWTDVEIELILDEEDPTYKIEEQYRRLASYVGTMLEARNVITAQAFGERPY